MDNGLVTVSAVSRPEYSTDPVDGILCPGLLRQRGGLSPVTAEAKNGRL